MAGTMTFVYLVDSEALEGCNDLFTSGVNQTQASLSTYCQPPHASRFLFPFLTAYTCGEPITALSVKARLSLLLPSFPTPTTSSGSKDTISGLLDSGGICHSVLDCSPHPTATLTGNAQDKTVLVWGGGKGRGQTAQVYTHARARTHTQWLE